MDTWRLRRSSSVSPSRCTSLKPKHCAIVLDKNIWICDVRCKKPRFQRLTNPAVWTFELVGRGEEINFCTGTVTQPPCQHPDDKWFWNVWAHRHLLLALAFFVLPVHINSNAFVARAGCVVCNLRARCSCNSCTHQKKGHCVNGVNCKHLLGMYKNRHLLTF